jgi:type III secretion protein Q
MFIENDRTVHTHFTPFRIARLYRMGTRRLTRAHLALQHRPDLTRRGSALLSTAAGALQSQLGTQLSAQANVLESVFGLDRHLTRDAAFALFELDAAGGLAVLEIEKPLLGAALERLSGGAGRLTPVTKLTRIEEAAFGHLALVALQAVRKDELVESLFAPRLKAVNPSMADVMQLADTKSPHVAVRIALKVGSAEGEARLFLPARLLQTAVESQDVAAPGPIPEEVLAANLSVRTFATKLQLDLEELRALQPGDVVLLDGLSVSDGALHGAISLQTRTFELFGVLGHDGFTLSRAQARKFPQEVPMSQPVSRDDAAPSLPVDVEVELTRLRLTVAELATIRPGSILPLRINGSDPVVLRVGDRAVARAELVEIEGEIGARILSLLS